MGIIGILPAGGSANRLHGLPKFLLPTADGFLLDWHMRQMNEAGADKVFISANKATQPFIKPFAAASTVNVMESQTVTEALLALQSRTADVTLYGMPDSCWTYPETYGKLLNRINVFGAEVAVGLWLIRNDQRGKLGQVDAQGDYCTRIVDKDPTCLLPWAWGAIAWTPRLWEFIKPEMSHMGLALQAAIDAGVKVWPVMMPGDYYDCGTFSEYALYCSTVAEMVYAR